MLKKIIIIVFICSFLLAVSNNIAVSMNYRQIVPELKYKDNTVGSHLSYSFYLENFPFQPSFNLQFRDPSQNENIMIVTQNIVKRGKDNYLFKAEIIPFQTGVINFPSFNILDLAIQPVAVTISSVIPQGTTVNLQESYPLYQDYSDIFLGLLLILILFAGHYLYKKYHKLKSEKEKIMTPQKAKNLWQELKVLYEKEVDLPEAKRYYFESSEKLKYFVSRVLNIEILELTTTEINQLLKNKELNKKQELLDALNNAELVKFAKYQPSAEEIKNYQKTALNFLEVYQPRNQEEQSDD